MPRLTDDGAAVDVDLHGHRVDDALRIARRALAVCVQRGRRRLRLVHGASTTAAGPPPAGAGRGVRTIKTALHAWLDSGVPDGLYVAADRGDAVLTLHLDLAARPDPRRLAVRDVAV